MVPSEPRELPDPCGPVLACPACQEDYLHHGRVEVFPALAKMPCKDCLCL